MGFRLNISGGPEAISLDERSIKHVDFDSMSAADSNARATDYGLSLKIWGKINYKLGTAGNDATLAISRWSQVPSERADCYRSVSVDVVAAGQVVRQFVLPDAFVVGYSEELNDESGVGTFYLYVKQKKDENVVVSIEGGFGNE